MYLSLNFISFTTIDKHVLQPLLISLVGTGVSAMGGHWGRKKPEYPFLTYFRIYMPVIA